MNPEKYYCLGLDTSAYTTSLALVDQDEKLIVESRLPLNVKEGSLGLRQSEAVFAHIENLPALWQGKTKLFDQRALNTVAASTRPRPVDDSYMPVFKVGEAFGMFLSQTMGLFYISSSHQEGHILAGLWSAGLQPGRYLVIHLSGGTTEIISAEEKLPGRLKINLLGGGADLNAGQFIDRIGLLMGLVFPAGPQIESLARKSQNDQLKLPVAVKGNEISFSGPASQAERLLNKGCPVEDLARAVEDCIADSMSAAVSNLHLKINDYQGLLAVGGVTANLHIRERLKQNLSGWNLYFARPEYAADNAVGLAVQAARCFKENQQENR